VVGESDYFEARFHVHARVRRRRQSYGLTEKRGLGPANQGSSIRKHVKNGIVRIRSSGRVCLQETNLRVAAYEQQKCYKRSTIRVLTHNSTEAGDNLTGWGVQSDDRELPLGI
jgi:hypothetical protein